MRVLVVEDEADQRVPLVIAFRDEGWEVFEAEDGRDALRVYHNAIEHDEYFRAIIWDVKMPRLSGFAAGINIRNLEGLSKIPRAVHIYLTGFDDTKAKRDELMQGEVLGKPYMDEYIRKPVSPDELIARIKALTST